MFKGRITNKISIVINKWTLHTLLALAGFVVFLIRDYTYINDDAKKTEPVAAVNLDIMWQTGSFNDTNIPLGFIYSVSAIGMCIAAPCIFGLAVVFCANLYNKPTWELWRSIHIFNI